MENRDPNVDDIYLAALERDSGEARSSYLDEACAGNPELRRRGTHRELLAVPAYAALVRAYEKDAA